MKTWGARLKPYFVTLAVVVGFTWLKLSFNDVFEIESPLLLYYSAVIVAAWLGGFSQGLLASALCLLAAHLFFVFPADPSGGPSTILRMILFIVDCTFIVAFAWALERSRRRAQLALSEADSAQLASDQSEQRFRRIFESDMIGLIFTKGDGTIVDANGYFLKMLGYSRHDLKDANLNWERLTPAEFLSASHRAFQLMKSGGVAPPFEKAYLRNDGATVPVLVGAADLGGDQTVKFVLDITERQRTERALGEAYTQLEDRVVKRTIDLRDIAENLRQSQSFLDSVIENIPNMLFVKDAKDLKFLRFNRAGEDLLGYSRNDLIGKNDYDLFPKAEADFFVSKDRAVLDGGVVVDIPEEPLSTKSGLRYLHTKKIPILDTEGRPKYLLGISEDVTGLKLAETQRLTLIQEQAARVEAEKSADQLRFLAEVSSSVTESLDPKHMLASLAKLVAAKFADWCTIELLLDDESGLQEPIIAHRDPEQVRLVKDLHLPTVSEAIRTGEPIFKAKVSVQDFGSKFRDLSIQSVITVPLQSYGKVFGALTLISCNPQRLFTSLDLSLALDVARRASIAIENARLFTKAQEASRAKSAFLANMSHEIRTPLGAMLGFSELLADDHLTATQRQYLSTIAKNGQHLLRIVDEILDLSKVESDHIHVENIEFPLSTLMTDTLAPLRLQAKEKGLQFKINFDGLPDRAISDPTRLRQILINLIGNAIKFTAKGEITVDIKVTRHPRLEGRSLLKVSVKDTGIGITREQQERLFQPFVQADSSMTRRFGGTGLGLFLSRRLAQLLGGDVVLEESSNRGSRFSFTSVFQIKNNESIETTENARSKSAQGVAANLAANGKVLIVDDAPDNRTLIYLYVSRLGYHVDVAATGAEGVEKALSENYDVILMDVQMPEMDGFEAVKILRSKQYTKPIVALTAHTMKGDRENCLANGFDDYLGKPIDRDLLQTCLTSLTKRPEAQ